MKITLKQIQARADHDKVSVFEAKARLLDGLKKLEAIMEAAR